MRILTDSFTQYMRNLNVEAVTLNQAMETQ